MGSSAHEQDDDLEDWAIDYSGQGPHARHADGVTADALSASALQPLLTTIAPTDEGLRLDTCVAKLMPQVSRSMIQKWIGSSCITIDGRVVKASATVHAGQTLAIRPPEPEPVNEWQPEPMALDIVFEDAQVMVVNKPVGLVVHPAAGHAGGTLVNGLIALCPDLRQVARAGIVHRLDRDTSGLMVVAKTSQAQFSLVKQLQDRSVSRVYLALAWGEVRPQEVRTMMGRDPRDRQKMAVVGEGRGKEAITGFSVLAGGVLYGQPVSLLRCVLQTGRTHQIRVHAEHVKSPLVGDRTYHRHSPHANRLCGGKKEIDELMIGQALHAHRLRFLHPMSDKEMGFEAPPPPEFIALCSRAGIDLEPVLK